MRLETLLRQTCAISLLLCMLMFSAIAEAALIWQDSPDPTQVIIMAAGFGVATGISRLFFWWTVGLSWQRRVGSVFASIIAAVGSSLLFYEVFSSMPTLIMATAILFGWLGGDTFEGVAKRYVQRLTQWHLGSEDKDPKGG